MRIGAEDLLKRFGTVVDVAEAMIMGELSSYETDFARDIVTPTVIAAAEARMRLRARGVLPAASAASAQDSMFRIGTKLRQVEDVPSDKVTRWIDEVEVLEHGTIHSTHLLTVKSQRPDGQKKMFISKDDGANWHQFTGGDPPSHPICEDKEHNYHFLPLTE